MNKKDVPFTEETAKELHEHLQKTLSQGYYSRVCQFPDVIIKDDSGKKRIQEQWSVAIWKKGEVGTLDAIIKGFASLKEYEVFFQFCADFAREYSSDCEETSMPLLTPVVK